MTICTCQPCARRTARGEAPFDGVSVMREMHVTEADLGASRRKSDTPQAVTRAELDGVIEAVAAILEQERARRKAQVAALQKQLGELESRVRPAEVEERLGKVEQRTAEFRYTGVWQPGNYQVGNFCTDAGSLWHCNAATTSRPGTGGDWQLCVKRGEVGHDAEASRRSTRSSR